MPDERARELIAWADTYGEPEDWAKRAQDAHARAERLQGEVEMLRLHLDSAQRRVSLLLDRSVCVADIVAWLRDYPGQEIDHIEARKVADEIEAAFASGPRPHSAPTTEKSE